MDRTGNLAAPKYKPDYQWRRKKDRGWHQNRSWADIPTCVKKQNASNECKQYPTIYDHWK
jgi:hypothetical protein